MLMSQYDSGTQKALQRLSENLEGMPRNMRQFSSVFRALYSDQAVGGQSEAAVKFRKIRDDTRQDAMVYLQCVLPATTNLISSVKEYFEYYEALSYEEWCEMVPDILKETRTHKDLAQTVLGMHQDIMVPLKTRQDRARVVMTEFVNLQSVYHSSEGSRQKNMARAVASEKQYEINKNAARIVAETLIPALSRFIDGLQEVARFFQIIQNELESFGDKSEGDMNERKQSYYKVIRNSAREIKSLCVAFYAVLPDVRTDFEALPSEDTDQNYVDKWLEKQLTDTRSQTTLVLIDDSHVPTSKKKPVPPPKNRPPADTSVTTSKNKPPISPNRSTSTPINDSVTTMRYKRQVPKHKPRPVSTPLDYLNTSVTTSKHIPPNIPTLTPINDSVTTMRDKQAPKRKPRPASTPFDYLASAKTSYMPVPTLTNTTTSTPTNEAATKNYIPAPTSTPVDIPVPKSKNEQAKSPKITPATTLADNSTPLPTRNKRATSKDDSTERKQQRCPWKCIIT